jgi:hypothetical protein
MDRERLEILSLDELKRDALRYHLPVHQDRGALIEALMEHLNGGSSATNERLTTRAKSYLKPRNTTQLKNPDTDSGAEAPPSANGFSAPTLDSLAETLKICLE